jgi:hypothetical protein
MDRKVELVIAGAAATAVLSSGVANADLKRIRDPRGDSQGTIDIGRAVADHYKGLLRHKIVTYGPFRSSNPQRPCVFIDGPSGKYRICGHTVYNFSKHRRAGRALMRRPDAHSIIYLFSPETIGNPPYYRWLVGSVGFPVTSNKPRSCKRTGGFCDIAPGNFFGIRHRLR